MDIIANRNRHEGKCINKVALTGSVVHKYRPRDSVIILTVAVNGGMHEVDYPNVAFYGADIAENIDKAIEVSEDNYPRVRITGTVQTSRKETDNGVRHYQTIVGDTIARAQTQMEKATGIRGIGTRKADGENDVCLLGKITYIYPVVKDGADEPTGAILTIRTYIDGRSDFPRVACFGVRGAYALGLDVGDTVCVTGYLETTNRTRRDGSRGKFESVIATEVSKVDTTTAD